MRAWSRSIRVRLQPLSWASCATWPRPVMPAPMSTKRDAHAPLAGIVILHSNDIVQLRGRDLDQAGILQSLDAMPAPRHDLQDGARPILGHGHGAVRLLQGHPEPAAVNVDVLMLDPVVLEAGASALVELDDLEGIVGAV